MAGPTPPDLPGPTGPAAPTGAAAVVIGVLRLATGRADGAARFTATPQAYLSSLAPWLAFLLVGTVLRLLRETPAPVLRDVLAALIALLAPAVLSHAIAFAWKREEGWLRYAVAYNWCQWALLPALLLILIGLGAAVAAGMGQAAAANTAVLLVAAYALWLHWVVSRAALGLSSGRAVLFVLLVNLGTAALVFGPALLTVQVNQAG